MRNLIIYIISCRDFEERHKSIEQQLNALGLSYTYVFEHDVSEIERGISIKVTDEMPLPNKSCLLKHLEAQKKLISSEKTVALVLEDDSILSSDFLDNLKLVLEQTRNLEPGWLVFLGGTDNKLDARFFEQNDTRLIESPLTTAEAYLMDVESCRRRLNWISYNEVSLSADHLLKYLDSILDIRQYRVARPMVSQGSITGLFQTTLDDSRRKHSRLFLSVKFGLKRFSRQVFPRYWQKFCRILRWKPAR